MSKDVITVFGGSGFLGRHIVSALSEAGYQVRVAARHPERTDFSGLQCSPETVSADIRDSKSVERAVRGAAAVINAVSLYAETGDLDFDSIHVRGAERVARYARQANVRALVHISGIGVDTESQSKYVRARARGEHGVRRAFPDASILRPSVLFGPGDDFLSTLDMVTRLPVIPLFGKGQTRLQPVHAADVAAAARVCATRSTCRGRIYELGGARVASYREIVQAVLAERGRRRLLMPMPFALWHLLAAATSPLPGPPLTRDQVFLMQEDNLVSPEYPGFPELGYKPAGIIDALTGSLPGGSDSLNRSARPGHGK